MTRIVIGSTISRRRCGALLAFIFPRPVNRIAGRQLDGGTDLSHRFLHRATQVPSADAELYRDVAGVRFAINLRAAICLAHLRQLRQ